ncbi:MAG: hypothetical protein RMZ41_006350 [Nostoc sp. DedVER02]|uniref:hypothetical protein n=1 Tax=Nostoc sp. DedVER01b TaxID=3075404 RepID=UPI002AD47BCE|nr:hypothetical protein [Nostoc sp. DedVER02]MDZ8111559.1 hypothetical protein [Nostoc sp. DedVER01b]
MHSKNVQVLALVLRLLLFYLLLITHYLLLIINRFGACEKCGLGAIAMILITKYSFIQGKR